ncbi:hypothetical protein K504DRAFT_461957 [Pleomassaria siparia CBS 279.74]|uniref:Uncharacterized protein n=1 Tax=Pleomassaria siparia CBS 279.74 TaxID=1314801 RepID=A0A6G1KLD0_9PLEO|nr:hypothetical protein K504DRAFT_461957 [Pleomassaria siparia CBS 279.74]
MAAANISSLPSWLPTNAALVHFSNCTLASQFYAQSQGSGDLLVHQTTDLFYDGLSDFWAANNITQPRPAQVISFLVDSESLDQPLVLGFVKQLFTFVENECRADYCKILPWQGNADLNGRGMLVSYFVQAILVTFYMIVLGLGRLKTSSRMFKNWPKYERVLVAVQESTKSFLDASMLFCIVVLVASLYIFARALDDQNVLITTYAQFSSTLVSLFTLFPTLVLHSCASNHLRRGGFRQCVWLFIGCLTIVVMALFLNGMSVSAAVVGIRLYKASKTHDQAALDKESAVLNQAADSERQNRWEVDCVDPNIVYTFLDVIVLVMCLITVFTVIYLAFVKNVFRIPFFGLKGYPRLNKFRKIWWCVSASLAFVGMWASLGAFVYYRINFNKLAGATNKDNEWSFGQVLALSTWVPVVVELLFIGNKGAIVALTGQMSDKYQVVHAPVVEHVDTDMSLTSHGDDGEKGKYEPVVM